MSLVQSVRPDLLKYFIYRMCNEGDLANGPHQSNKKHEICFTEKVAAHSLYDVALCSHVDMHLLLAQTGILSAKGHTGCRYYSAAYRSQTWLS